MSKDTAEKRSVEQADQLVSAINRLAAAIEQQNARPPVAGLLQTMGTPLGTTTNVPNTVLPFRHYNEKPSEAQHEQQGRNKVRRRPRQASRGKG